VAVHHGGAGTTAEALRAGTPSVVVPVVPDQEFWGWRVHALGAAPPPIPHKDLTPENLLNAVQAATTDPEMRRHRETLASRISAEDGISRAVEAIEHHAGQGRR
jgi:sterol 3beta-glucosyltransferase